MGANAVTTVPVYTAGEVLTAADMNITNSGIPVFATTVTRDAGFGGTGEKTLAEGQACYIEGTGLQVYNGTAWRPYGYRQTFTPSFTNFTLGNGTVNYASYTQIDDLVFVEVRVTLGSTSSMGTNPQMALPITSPIATTYAQLGPATLLDTGVALFSGQAFISTLSNVVELQTISTSGSYSAWTSVTATVPFTWGNTDSFMFTLTYTV